MAKIGKDIFISGFSDEISSNLDKQIEVVKSCGMNYLCLRDIDGINIGKYTLEEFEQKVFPRLKKSGMKVSSLGSPIGKIFIDDEKAHKEQLIMLKELCKIGKLLDCKYIRIFSFYIKDEKIEKCKEAVIRKLREFVKIAEENDIVLIHENEKDIYGDIALRCSEIMTEINSPYFRSAFDFANFVQCGENTLEAYEMLKEYIEYIHIKDANYSDNQNVVCGTGTGKIKEILDDIINKRNYKGFLTLEPHLVQFEGLKNLELGNVNEIIKNENKLTGEQGFILQHKALLNLLEKIGVE